MRTLKILALSLVGALLIPAVHAGEMAVHGAVAVTDGSTRLVTCQNARGAFLLVRPVEAAEAYVVRSDVGSSLLSDLLENIMPAGWTVRYGTPNVDREMVSLDADTYWVDALRILSHDFNLLVAVDGERREVMVGRL